MAKVKRGALGYPGDFLEQARQAVRDGKIVFDGYAKRKAVAFRGVSLDDVVDGLLAPEAEVDPWPQNNRFDQQRKVWSRRINTTLEGRRFRVVCYFYFPERSDFPDVLSIHNAYFPDEDQGKRPW